MREWLRIRGRLYLVPLAAALLLGTGAAFANVQSAQASYCENDTCRGGDCQASVLEMNCDKKEDGTCEEVFC